MSSSNNYWQIVATDRYIEQVSRLHINIQSNILNQWIEVAKHDDPREVGSWDDCGNADEDCPFIVVIFAGLPFEFMYEMDKQNRLLRVMDCYQLDIFHPFEQ